ncbi:hypothetical protein ATO12_05650 [Aquimarina atlantica]|uniref:Uncharacterized protein n=1 Tax=Aquimarina atlantica TaxID=1317122 RepID=A0A023BPJ4_9FLAO|nr:hypothetical protein [Aquimarina atlantica]EZH71864.1 hypothetical protein ATO12_05650 [Aquimarina atlantica]
MIFLISCEKSDHFVEDQDVSSEIEESSDTDAKIILSNGNSIRFHQINDGELQGTFLLEESDCESCSVLNNITKIAGKDISEADIFWALSEPGTVIPSFLKNGNNSFDQKNSKQQGWARNVALDLPITIETNPSRTIVACKNSNFTGSIAGGFLGNPEFVALDKTPNNYNGFVDDCANLSPSACNKGTRYKLHAVMHGIKKWRGKICSKAVQSSTNDHYISNSIGGHICQSPPCSAYVGPELYFEYYSNRKWKSMKNPSGQYPEGFEVPANTTKVYSYWWNTSTKTSFRLRVKNAMGKDQFDFMMDQPDPVVTPPGGGNPPTPEDFPQLPAHIELSHGTLGGQNYRIVVDFTTIIDKKPRITIPEQFLPVLPEYDGEVIFPNNFCGMRILKADRFIWETGDGQLVNQDPYNYVPEDSSIEKLFGFSIYNSGIEFSGPIGACHNSNENWAFPFPFTDTGNMTNQPLRLTIELLSDSEIEFLNHTLPGNEPLDAHELFEEVDFDELIAFYNETFYEGFEQWIDAVCEENPNDCPLQD